MCLDDPQCHRSQRSGRVVNGATGGQGSLSATLATVNAGGKNGPPYIILESRYKVTYVERNLQRGLRGCRA